MPPSKAPSLIVAALMMATTLPTLAENKKSPERFESDIAKFEARDRSAPPQDGAVLFVGSSSIRMWDLKKYWPDTAVINNGFGGSTLADSIHFFPRHIAPYNPSAIVIYAGDNDVAAGLTAEEVLADYKKLVALISESSPDVPVVFIAIKPSEKRWNLWPTMKAANALVEAECRRQPHLHYADIAAPMLDGAEGAPAAKWFKKDGLHLSPFGYEQWTDVVRNVLEKAGVLR